ncbi:hypothetical protein LOAG_12541 [Loa loa]|uniref:Uncharacterized protein n=1 Tax=Loa loa TaxID=7209 RepID=A0A1S0TMH8_LOALO|nr:hypothetical protein LOAG_12541 [Loa loa]EFO15969.1 hypothetical protein LOAG_12541 [Loa loa]
MSYFGDTVSLEARSSAEWDVGPRHHSWLGVAARSAGAGAPCGCSKAELGLIFRG